MYLTKIEGRELLSFETCCLPDLPTRMLILVGPNGAGKSNVRRLLEVVVAAVERAATSSQEAYALLAQFGAGRRFEAPVSEASRVRVGVVLTEAWERALLVGFVRAALVSSVLRDASSDLDATGLQGWADAIRPAELAPLERGEIVAELVDPTTASWTLGYEFEVDEKRFRWVLEGRPAAGAIVSVDDADRAVSNQPVAQTLELDGQRVPRAPFTLDAILPPPGEGRMLSIESGALPAAPAVREWATLAGVTVEATQRRGFTLAWVLRVLLERALAVLGDYRDPPQALYSLEEVEFDVDLASGSQVPVGLFGLKNGSPVDRARFVASKDVFNRLTGLDFDVTLASAAGYQAGRSELTRGIVPVVGLHGRDLPVELAGAGIWEALLLSAAVSDSAGRIVVLDEPARNLHPVLQGRLLSELRNAAGQFIVTTHSPYLVPSGTDSETSIVRLSLEHGKTRVHRLVTGTDGSDARLRKALAQSADARALLFARGVVLVEGGTEFGALPEWFRKSQTAAGRGAADILNIAVFSVDGDANFGTFVRYLHGLGVPWAIVCDGRALQLNADLPRLLVQLAVAGVSPEELRAAFAGSSRPTLFSDLRTLAERFGVFTLADTWDPPAEGFEAYIERGHPGRLASAREIVGTSKPRQGLHVATETDCPPEVDMLYRQLLDHLGLV